ncbi:MAG: hypothetical protein HXY20_01365 [Acidobacteria bacterium]|nr:hypothetical protein [Acidobacteriota bacterium]
MHPAWALEMAPSQHLTISVGSGVILGLLTRSWIAGVSCSLVGVLVDLDHFIDFWLNRGLSLDIQEFFEFNYYGNSRRFFDFLHGYELIPLLWYLTSLAGWPNARLGLTLGYAIHLLGDQFFNTHLNRWTYFLAYRLYHGFDAVRIVRRRPLTVPDLSKSHPDE